MIIPSRKLLLLMLPQAAVLLIWPDTLGLAWAMGVNVILALLTMMDLLISARPGELRLTRLPVDRLSMGALHQITWEIRNGSFHDVEFQIMEEFPQEIQTDRMPIRGAIRSHSDAEMRFGITCLKRGRFQLEPAWFRWKTRLGLLIRQKRIGQAVELKVQPSVENVRRFMLASLRRRQQELGLTASRRRGQGSMFESLRDYVPGDEISDVAWKASAKRNRLITRNFEADKNQNILILLDCGRNMAAEIDSLTRLDHSINACMLLAHVAGRQSDQVGLLAFSDRIETYVPPVKGRQAVGRLNDAMYRLEPRICDPNYDMACRYLSLRHRKRSLIVVFTDVVDAVISGPLLTHLARFARYHLPICVTLRNKEVMAMATQRAAGRRGCFEQAVALRLLEAREHALASMRATGVDVLECDSAELAPALIDRYLTHKLRLQL